jgi:ketosteroid isomerase-like protein
MQLNQWTSQAQPGSLNPPFAALIVSDDTQRNAEVLKNLYAAISTQDKTAAAELLSADLILHVPGRGLLAGDYWGHQGFETYLSKLLEHAGGSLRVDVPVLSVNGQDAFAREVVTARRRRDPEREWQFPVSVHYKLKAGKVSEMWVLPDDQRLYDQYWTPSSEDIAASGSGSAVARVQSAQLPSTEEIASPQNLTLITNLYERFFRGDMEVMQDAIAEDVIVNIVGRSALSGEYHGWDGFMAFRGRLMSMVYKRYKLEVTAFAASRNDAWAREYIRMDRPWDPNLCDIEVVMHFEIKDGKVKRIDDFPVDTFAWERFYCPPGFEPPGL